MWITAKQMHFAVMLDGDRQLVETQRCINFDHGLMYRPDLTRIQMFHNGVKKTAFNSCREQNIIISTLLMSWQHIDWMTQFAFLWNTRKYGSTKVLYVLFLLYKLLTAMPLFIAWAAR